MHQRRKEMSAGSCHLKGFLFCWVVYPDEAD